MDKPAPEDRSSKRGCDVGSEGIRCFPVIADGALTTRPHIANYVAVLGVYVWSEKKSFFTHATVLKIEVTATPML
ncbi:hypothetical protein QE152_g18114 [Popillia japonica]|uniref:Uncharacterized protein n=1 Tax=Popillia japonica TaxID=7064 RepID=A0AAW1L5N1_POPJA